MNQKDDRANIDAMLRHLGCGGDLRDFPGTSAEKIALVRIAGVRRLIAWSKARARYELTPVGWSEVTPRRRFGVASLMVSSAIGAIVGATALALVWLPADASHRSTRGQSSASVSRLEKPIATSASPWADASVGSSAPPQTTSVVQNPAPAVAHDPGPSGGPGNLIEPAMAADQPVPEQPSTEVAPTSIKQVAVKKSHHRRRREQTWAYADPWRAHQFRSSGYGGQGSWLGYR